MRSGPAHARNYDEAFDGMNNFADTASVPDDLNYWPVDLETHIRNIERLIACVHAPQDTAARWTSYLASLPARGLATAEVSSSTIQLWESLVDIASVAPPDASPTADGGLLMSWDRADHHLEIEVLNDASYEWFYRNRRLGKTASGVGATGDDIPEELVARIVSLTA